MLGNIIDKRSDTTIATKINVVFEASAHDNSLGGDQHPEGDAPACDVKYEISLDDAVSYANTFKAPVTLFLYDAVDDPMAIVP